MGHILHIISPKAPKPLENVFTHDLYYLIHALAETGIKPILHLPFYEQLDTKTYENTNQLFRYKNSADSNSRALSLQFVDEALENIHSSNGPVLFYGDIESLLYLKSKCYGTQRVFYRLLTDEKQFVKDILKISSWDLHRIKNYFKITRLDNNFQKLESSEIICLAGQPSTLEEKIKGVIIPVFTGIPFVFFHQGKGSFCLFHGDLNEKENEYAAFWLLEHVFNKIEIPFVIAGSNPSEELEKAAHLRMHTCLVSNPSESELHELIKKAQINLLPSFLSERRDMNLYRCMNLGKHILTNTKGLPSILYTGSITVADSPDQFIQKIPELFEEEFQEEDHHNRENVLNRLYQDQHSVQELIKHLF